MHKAFVCYSRDDVLQVQEIDRALQEKRVTFWRDQQSRLGSHQQSWWFNVINYINLERGV